MRSRVLSSAFPSALAVLVLAAAHAGAQEAAHGHRTVLSVQPLAAIFTVYSAEIERAISPTLSVGLSGTHWDFHVSEDEAGGEDELTFQTGDLKLRYYPSGRALQGFAFGGSVGYTRGEEKDATTGATSSAGGPTLGLLLDYSWLLNERRSFYIGLGVGAKVLFIDEDEFDDDDDFNPRYPTARFSVGWAF